MPSSPATATPTIKKRKRSPDETTSISSKPDTVTSSKKKGNPALPSTAPRPWWKRTRHDGPGIYKRREGTWAARVAKAAKAAKKITALDGDDAAGRAVRRRGRAALAASAALDSPWQLPGEVRHVVPRFDTCGQQNCGRHAPPPETASSSSATWVRCRDCKNNEPAAGAHRLPCGHALCRACLNDAVTAIEARVMGGASWAAIEQCLYDHFFEASYEAPSEASSEASSETPHGEHEDAGRPLLGARKAFDRALAAAGFTCCGRPMRLDGHMACMDADAAASYWLAHEALRWPPDLTRHQCGWPDCRWFLAPECGFARGGAAVFYCARCRGNSLFVREGQMVPARE